MMLLPPGIKIGVWIPHEKRIVNWVAISIDPGLVINGVNSQPMAATNFIEKKVHLFPRPIDLREQFPAHAYTIFFRFLPRFQLNNPMKPHSDLLKIEGKHRFL